MKTDKILFGAAYYSEYLPCDRVEKDMELMERAGMNTIRIAESTWSTLEPRDGVFDFTHLDRMLEAAAKHNISVIIGTPTYAVPTWLVTKYPDLLAVTKNGRELYGHRQNMDITHPGYLKHAKRMITALMEHIRDIPHIIGFQLDNETKSYGTAGPRVQQMFVDYLKSEFSDLDELNRVFGLDYWSNRINAWEDFPDVRGTINQSLSAEFKKFQRLLVTTFLNWQSDIIETYKRDDQFITQNFDFGWTTHSYGYQPEVNQFEAARCLTVAGCDIYHPSQDDLTGAEVTVCGNIARGLKHDNYLILETQAQGNPQWLPYPRQLRLLAYSHISNGSNSVMYWHWHSIHNAIESYWKGVLSHDFSENETYLESCCIGEELKRIGDRLKNIRKENRVAVMLDNASLSGLTEFPVGSLGEHSYNRILRWLCDAMYRMNLEFDIISSDERSFGNYRCLVVPALYSADDDLLNALTDFVRNGGHLISTFRSAFSDEHLKIYHDTQPHILNKCLGLHYDQFTIPKDVRVVSRPTDAETELSAVAHEWMELCLCDFASPVAIYDHPAWNRYAAAAKNKFGKGSSLYFGAFFEGPLFEKILSDYLKEVCVLEPWHEKIHFPIIIKRGKNDFGRMLCYYFNYSGTEQTVSHIENDGTELLSGKLVSEGDRITISPWNVKIIECM